MSSSSASSSSLKFLSLNVFLFSFLLLNGIVADEISCQLCQGIAPSIAESLQARTPINVDNICQPFGRDMFETCIDFLTVYGKTMLKKISQGEEDVCSTLYDRNLISLLLGMANYLCDENNAQPYQRDANTREISQKEIKVPAEQIQALNMNFLLHIEIFQSTRLETIENSEVTSSTTVLQETETTFFEDPNGDIWREEHTQIIKTGENPNEMAFFDFYNLEKVNSPATMDHIALIQDGGNTIIVESLEVEMRSKEEVITSTTTPSNGKLIVFIGLQSRAFIFLITLLTLIYFLFVNHNHHNNSTDSEYPDEKAEFSKPETEAPSNTVLVMERSLIRDDKKDFAFFYPQVKLPLVENDAL